MLFRSLQNLVDSMNNEINKPSFIKDVDKTITGFGKELEKGIYSFGQFIGNFVEENIDFNESDKGCKEMDWRLLLLNFCCARR